MDKERITMNEVQNDGKTIHLYYNAMVGFYTAYGLSAFYVTHVVNPVASFSDDMQMPVAIVNKRQVLELRQSLRRVEHNEHSYYRFETRSHIGDEGYQAWLGGVRERYNRMLS